MNKSNRSQKNKLHSKETKSEWQKQPELKKSFKKKFKRHDTTASITS